MRIGVERPVEHDLAEQAVEQRAGQRGPHLGGHPGLGGGQRPAVETLHHEHRLPGERLMRDRDPDAAAAPRG